MSEDQKIILVIFNQLAIWQAKYSEAKTSEERAYIKETLASLIKVLPD
jgi:hypothetical protein